MFVSQGFHLKAGCFQSSSEASSEVRPDNSSSILLPSRLLLSRFIHKRVNVVIMSTVDDVARFKPLPM